MNVVQSEANKRILIIDDDTLTSDMYMYALSHAGYTVDIVTSGREGQIGLNSGKYDLVLLDLMLPDLNGCKILAKWRQTRPLHTRPSIIVLTNCDQDESSRKLLEKAADAYAVKASTTPRKLLKLIASILDK